ncbi:MAG: WG repeat-containing protein [Pyrinomonadaceae bacterium]
MRKLGINRNFLFLLCLGVLSPAAAQNAGDQERKRQPSGLYQVYRDEKSGRRSYGFIDKTGKLVIGFDQLLQTTDRVGDFSEGLAAIYLKKEKGDPADYPDIKAGYIDATGKIVIAPRWRYAGDFSDGLAVVQSKEFSGYINRRGEEVIKLDEFPLKDFHGGLAAVGWNPLQANSGYIDHSGKLVIERKYSFADEFSEGLAGVVVNRKYGFINQKGEMVIAPRFIPLKEGDAMITARTSRFSEGLACVRVDAGYGYIDKQGNFVIQPQFNFAQEFSEGLAWVVTQEGKIGWIDRAGRWAVVLGEGARLPGEHGLLYTHGEVDLRYSEGLAPSITHFQGNYLSGYNYFWGYMDKQGGTVIRLPGEVEYAKLRPFSGGIAKVSFYIKGNLNKEKDAYVNRSGQFIWRSN